MALIDVEIDAITTSVVHARSGRSYRTRIVPWNDLADWQRDLVRERPHPWLFDWFGEAAQPDRTVAALLVTHSEGIEGLICYEQREDHAFVHLVENAPHNIGKRQRYKGVAANLFAYVCRESARMGFEGAVAFDSKSELIKHYTETMGAKQVGRSIHMVIDEAAAEKLIHQYFKKGDEWV